MNYYVRLVRHTDSAWHDRFFTFVAAIFKGGGQTFSDWAARGGWGKGYDVFAMVADDQIVSTVGRTTIVGGSGLPLHIGYFDTMGIEPPLRWLVGILRLQSLVTLP
jgi:hypothetical protein